MLLLSIQLLKKPLWVRPWDELIVVAVLGIVIPLLITGRRVMGVGALVLRNISESDSMHAEVRSEGLFLLLPFDLHLILLGLELILS